MWYYWGACGLTSRGMQSMIDFSPMKMKKLDIGNINLDVGNNLIGNLGIKLLIKTNLPNLI